MSKNPAKISVIQSIPKAPDLECHIRVVEVEGVKVAELRDYIPSLKTYGRGYWIPLKTEELFSVVNGLTEAARVAES